MMGWATSTRDVICIALPLLAILLAVRWPKHGSRIERALLQITSRFGRVPRKTMISFACASLLLCLLTRLALFSPVLSVHDEFAYALTADTFSQGRLSNSTHPFSEHFASWHIIQSPTYQAKYPPAQGAAMALGQTVFHEPLVGVWLSFAAAMAALAWACLGWLPRRWAFFASLLVLFNVPMSFEWGNSYWGGAMAMLGGSLVVGGLGRLRTRTRMTDGLCFGVGLCILAASRPFEGALMTLPIGLAAIGYSVRRTKVKNLKFWGPALLASFIGVAFLMAYNHAVTGQIFTMPYQVWADQQGDTLNRQLTPSIMFAKETGTNDPMAANDWRSAELASWMEERSSERVAFTLGKMARTAFFFLQSILVIPILALFWPIGNRRLWPLFAALLFVIVGLGTHLSAGNPHYVAGLTPIVAILCVAGLRKIRLRLPSLGKPLVGNLFAAWIVIAVATVAAEAIDSPHAFNHAWALRRSQLTQEFDKQGGRHVVFIHYSPDHHAMQEWVYNSSTIDTQSVIWANDLGAKSNQRLLSYYSHLNESVQGWKLVVFFDQEILTPLGREDSLTTFPLAVDCRAHGKDVLAVKEEFRSKRQPHD